jgi:L-asparaginase
MKEVEKIVVLGTGGTIAGTAAQASDHVGYTSAQLGVDQLLAVLPGLPRVLSGRSLVVEQVAQLDSKDMDVATWQALVDRCAHWLSQPDVHSVVVTHGTDTLEETAWFLQAVLQPAKSLVLTCAMRPATALVPDGPQNLMDALAVAGDAPRAGTWVVCAGSIHSARQVQKVHPYRLDAFSSGDAGPVGWVEDGRVRWSAWAEAPRPEALRPAASCLALVLQTPSAQWPWIEVVLSHACASRQMVDALVQSGVQGLVVAGTGNGSLHSALEAGLQDAARQGVQVRLSTRCMTGQIVGTALPWPDVEGLSPVKARISLLLSLMGALDGGLNQG